MCAAINIRLLRSRGLVEKLANQTLFFLVLDSREEFRPELRNRLCLIKRKLVVNLAALKVARLAASLEDRFNLGIKVWLRGG